MSNWIQNRRSFNSPHNSPNRRLHYHMRGFPKHTVTALFAGFVFVLCGCAPTVRLTVEHRDKVGNLVERFDVTNTDSGPRTLKMGNFDTLTYTAVAEFNQGLQALWVDEDVTCSHTSGTGTGNVQQTGDIFPPSGNAIPANQTPAQFSFTGNLAVAHECNGTGITLKLRAGARTVPTGGGGPATSWTQFAVFEYP